MKRNENHMVSKVAFSNQMGWREKDIWKGFQVSMVNKELEGKFSFPHLLEGSTNLLLKYIKQNNRHGKCSTQFTLSTVQYIRNWITFNASANI